MSEYRPIDHEVVVTWPNEREYRADCRTCDLFLVQTFDRSKAEDIAQQHRNDPLRVRMPEF